MSGLVGILGGMGSIVHFPPPAAPEPDHPLRPTPCVAGSVEAFFAHRDLAAETRHTYRNALGPLVAALDGDRPVTDLASDQVAAGLTERWARILLTFAGGSPEHPTDRRGPMSVPRPSYDSALRFCNELNILFVPLHSDGADPRLAPSSAHPS